ncbi:MAG: TonB-dependent receptor [Brevundimonas sp.]
MAAPTQLDEVVVVGRRGAARLAPERELGAEEIDNLGAYDIGEVINRISENLGLQQPPLIIVNGRRVVDPRNFVGFPPDALSRLEILPQQAGAMYGGDPSRRVVNIVLVPEFRSRDGLVKALRPTGGGTSTLAVDARQSQLKETDTLQFGVEAARTTSLRASERPAVLEDNLAREGATLRPATHTASANLSMTGTVGDWATSLTASAQEQRTRFSSRVAGTALDTRQGISVLNASGGVSGSAYGWSVRMGLDAVAIESRQTGILDLTARDLSGVANLSADRTLIDLPAGPMLMTVDTQYSRARSETNASDGGTTQSSQALDVRSGLSLPIWSAQQDEGGASGGDLVVTLGGRFRTFDTAGADGQGLNVGFAWAPSSRYRFTGQLSRATDAPTRDQRFAPVLYGAPQTVYDFRSGEAVEILPFTGGNPDLRAQETQSASIGASAGPFGRWGLQGNLDLQSTRSTAAIGALPALTPATEAAFPDRFLRDATGRLFAVDQRAINLQEIASDILSSGLTANIPFGEADPRSPGRGSIQVSVSHTWRLADRLIIRNDLPMFDRLAGDGGGVPRHQVTLRMDGRFGRWGANLNAGWRSSARIRRDVGQDGPQDLLLSPMTTVGLKVSTVLDTNQGEATETPGRRRNDGLRLELEIENLFDARPGARLGDGLPAPGYGRDDQDPLGRTVRLTASRRF